MYQDLLRDERLYEVLFQCDSDLAREARRGGCGWCGGRVDQANYPRKPRGLPERLAVRYDLRLSLCCAVEGCRRRLTPQSVRFLGRRVYTSAAVVVLAAMRGGRRAQQQLRQWLGVSSRTLARWRRWWRTTFARSRFWSVARGRFNGRLLAMDLPRVLLGRFPGDDRSRLIALLRFLSPITTASAPECASYVRRRVIPRATRRRRAVRSEGDRD